MTRISRTRRLVLLTASAALAAGAALTSTTAFAAPAPAQAPTAVTQASQQLAGTATGWGCFQIDENYYHIYYYC